MMPHFHFWINISLKLFNFIGKLLKLTPRFVVYKSVLILFKLL